MKEGAARLTDVAAGASLVRIHPTGHDPLWFGPGAYEPPTHRFGAPDGSYGVCYLAHEPAGAFVETFLRDPELAGSGIRILSASELAAHAWVRVDVLEPLRLARLRGRGLAWRGVTASVSSTTRYDETQALSGRIHAEPSRPDGIEYRCRHDDDRLAVALFERGGGSVAADPATAGSCLDLAVRLQGAYPFVIDREG